MAIQPDGKDWTWVLDRPCPECGLDAGRLDPRDVHHVYDVTGRRP